MPVEEEPEKPKPKPKPEPEVIVDPIIEESDEEPEKPKPETKPFFPPEESDEESDQEPDVTIMPVEEKEPEKPKPEPRPTPIEESDEEEEDKPRPEPRPEPRPTPIEESDEEEEEKPKPVVEVYDTMVEDLEEGGLEEILAQADGKPVILDFQYDGCSPCQEIAPAFENLMINNSDSAIFRKVDIFQHKDMLAELGVKSLPTFKMWVDGKLFSTKVGTDLEDL